MSSLQKFANLQIHKFTHKEGLFQHKDNCIDLGCWNVNNNNKSDMMVSNFPEMIISVGYI